NPLKNKTMRTRQVVLICAFAVFCLSAFFACILLLVAFFKRKMHVIQRITFYIVIIVIAVTGTITYRLTDEFSKVMRAQLLAQMENMAHSVANMVRPAAVESIQCAADFASPSYREMIQSMESVIDPTLDVNRNIYCDILKYDDVHGAYACAYLDQAIGTYFPLPESSAEEIRQVYETKKSLYSSMDEYSGSYTYVYVPVISDEGRVCGVVAVLTENFMLTEQINGMKKRVLLGIVITLIFVWLAMGEALSYILSKSQAQMEAEERALRGEAVQKSFPHYYIRLMVFALFAAYNMTTTFLPMVITRGALESLGENCGTFIAALPISVNLFVIGLMALFCESLIRRAGLRRVIVFGTALSALSNLLIFALPFSYPMLFFALVIDGIGVGLSTNAMYLMVSQIPEAKNRTSGYAAYNAAQVSGINFGMLFGAALALSIGRRLIFPLVSVMWLVAAFLFVLLWKSLGIAAKQNAPEAEAGSKETFTPRRIFAFLSHRRIWSYILFVQAPFALMGSFVYYYLPLYSEQNALSEVVVAVLMMLYSMFAIYLGNSLTKWVIKRTGVFSPYAAIILSAAAVVVYASLSSFTGLLAAIFILGLANGFGRSVQQAHFSLLEECEDFGVPDAMGIYNFTEFIGQSFGPAVIGLVFLSRSLFTTTTAFAAVLVTLCAVHFVINLAKQKRRMQGDSHGNKEKKA
ncbi:MAG: MFS transporter, partial [Treponema sp.]|nr:MFS transporter [Treponema sp.]